MITDPIYKKLIARLYYVNVVKRDDEKMVKRKERALQYYYKNRTIKEKTIKVKRMENVVQISHSVVMVLFD